MWARMFTHQASDTKCKTDEHNYAVSGVSHIYATQQYHNALQTRFNTCTQYITHATEDLNAVILQLPAMLV